MNHIQFVGKNTKGRELHERNKETPIEETLIFKTEE